MPRSGDGSSIGESELPATLIYAFGVNEQTNLQGRKEPKNFN
jgi:hypothetical protein